MEKGRRTKKTQMRQLRLGAFALYILSKTALNSSIGVMLIIGLFTNFATSGIIKVFLIISIIISALYLVASFWASTEFKSEPSYLKKCFTYYYYRKTFIIFNLIAATMIILDVGMFCSLIS